MPRKNAVPSSSKNSYAPLDGGGGVKLSIRGRYTAIIDASMMDKFSAHTWSAIRRGEHMHLRASGGHLYAHHLVVGFPSRGQVVRHRNGNRLDLRRANLEITTQRILQSHTNYERRRASGVRGITANKGGWLARIIVDGERRSKWFTMFDQAKDWLIGQHV